ncbi:MAG: hypothetical protein PHQ81_10490, partial [Methanofollis sp.]|nr:hypothetical protein [Methanofollis sp.]
GSGSPDREIHQENFYRAGKSKTLDDRKIFDLPWIFDPQLSPQTPRDKKRDRGGSLVKVSLDVCSEGRAEIHIPQKTRKNFKVAYAYSDQIP